MGRTARTGPAHRDRGGDRLRERLDYARPAHGVRGTLWQESLRAAFEGHRRRRYHARPQPKELTKVWSRSSSVRRVFQGGEHSGRPPFNGPAPVFIPEIRVTSMRWSHGFPLSVVTDRFSSGLNAG